MNPKDMLHKFVEKFDQMLLLASETTDILKMSKIFSDFWKSLNTIHDHLRTPFFSESQRKQLDPCYYYLMFAERELDLSHNTIRDKKAFLLLLELMRIQVRTVTYS